jgi:hypothetical protein
VADWDGDGDLDLVLGFIQGGVRLYLNQGGLKFDQGTPLTAGGSPIQASDGGPALADWNRDGVLDLLLGDEAGGVTFYAGAQKGATDLRPGVQLLERLSEEERDRHVLEDPKAPLGIRATRPGIRAKPFAADWNADGKLDLLVGDFVIVETLPPQLTAEQVGERDRLRREYQDLLTKFQERAEQIHERSMEAANRKTGIRIGRNSTEEQRRAWFAAYTEARDADEEARRFAAEMRSIRDRLDPLEPRSEGTGFVWVYLRE